MVWKSCKHLLKLQNYLIEMANLSELIFMLWNAMSLNGKQEEFGYFIKNNNNNIDIALVTETWLNPKINLNFVNYDVIRSDFPRALRTALPL